MKYIKKEELIEGEIYKSHFKNQGDYIFIKNGNLINNTFINVNRFSKLTGNFRNENGFYEFSQTTPEEKHWLNSCITADKFITFEEAIKTFIPEYVECIEKAPFNFYGEIGTIYEVIDWNYSESDCMLKETTSHSTNKKRFKPSTKEAYDAQFVVKEPEFVLPEKWCILRNTENDKIVTDYINKISSMSHIYLSSNLANPYLHNNTTGCCSYRQVRENYTEITFEQFQKYVLKKETVEEIKVIEPLPQFKIIETIETITKIENNEGSQFFIGDVVKSSNGVIQTIESFGYNKNKTNIIAFTNKQSILGNGIGIDKIEHYIEPKSDYQILEYKTESGISCNAPFLQDSHQFYMNERCKIHSIKRISDNLIITVGDNVLSKTCGVPNKILSIELINNKIRLYPRNSFYNLEDILKINNK